MTTELDPFDLPRSAVAAAALEFASEHEDRVIFHHSVRCYLIGRSIGQARGWTDDLDDEALFLASILHDLGLTTIGNGHQRFEVDGADLADQRLVQWGLSAQRRKTIWTAIALHTTPDIAARMGPEAALLSLAAPIDGGIRDGVFPPEYLPAAERLLPRHGVQRALLEQTLAQTIARPEKAVPFTLPGELHRQMTGREFIDFRSMLPPT